MDTETPVLTAGTLVEDRYRVVRLLAEGGMSMVYEVEDARLAGRVVLKQMREIAAAAEARQQISEQFEREAEVLSRLSHPNLPRVTDFFTWDGQRYLVEEFVEGHTLEQLLAEQCPRREGEVVKWGVDICTALQFLHEHGIVYRDLKPSNVMVTPGGDIRLIDFGIVRSFTVGKARDTVIMGTPGFAAPEQYGLHQTDPRSDLYSLGALLLHLVSGYDPAASPFALPRVRDVNPMVSEALDRVLARALEVKPEKRFASADAMRRALLGQADMAAGGEVFVFEEMPWRPAHYVGAATAALGLGVFSVLTFPLNPITSSLGACYSPFWIGVLRWAWGEQRRRVATRLRADADGLTLEEPRGSTTLAWSEVEEVEFGTRAFDGSKEVYVRGRGRRIAFPTGQPALLPDLLQLPRLLEAERLANLVVEHTGVRSTPLGTIWRRP